MGTMVGRVLDKLPIHKLNELADRAARAAGFKNVGGWRRAALEWHRQATAEIEGSARRGLAPFAEGELPAFLQGLDMGRGDLNALMEQWLNESAFPLVANVGRMVAADSTAPDSADILDMLRAIDRTVTGATVNEAATAASIAKLSIGAPGSPPSDLWVSHEKELLESAQRQGPQAVNALYAYIPGPGTDATRQVLAARYSEEFGHKFSAENVALLASCKTAQTAFMLSVINRGQQVGGMTPEFPMHRAVPVLFGQEYLAWEPVIKEGKFDYRVSDLALLLKLNPRIRYIILSYPGNPAPFMFEEPVLKDIVELCYQKGIRIFVDAPYKDIMFPGVTYPNIFRAHPKAAEICVVALSDSKDRAIPGRRSGSIIGQEGIIRAISRIAVNVWSCPNVMNDLMARWASSQPALGQLREWAEGEARGYAAKSKVLVDQLNRVARETGALQLEEARGGFYTFPFFTDAFLESAGMQRLAEMGLPGVKGFSIYSDLVYKTIAIPGSSFADPDSYIGTHGIRYSHAGRPLEDVAIGGARACQAIRDVMAGNIYNVPDKYQPLVGALQAAL